jgi:hypothetical protein
MYKALWALILLAIAAPVLAADGDDVTYAGGTAPQLKEGTAGRFDFSSATHLRFVSSGAVLEIPYNGIESFEHSKEVAVHLGVAPAIAVGLVAARRHNHFVRITYKDSNQVPQAVVFEVPKASTKFLMPALEARAPQAQCRPTCECTTQPRASDDRSLPRGALTGFAAPTAPPSASKFNASGTPEGPPVLFAPARQPAELSVLVLNDRPSVS